MNKCCDSGRRLPMSEFFAFQATHWASKKGRDFFSLPSGLATHRGAPVALQQSRILRMSIYHSSTPHSPLFYSVTFLFEATIQPKLLFILRHYENRNQFRFRFLIRFYGDAVVAVGGIGVLVIVGVAVGSTTLIKTYTGFPKNAPLAFISLQ